MCRKFKMRLGEIQETQRGFDEKYWYHRDLPTPEQIRHTLLHLVKLNGKIATYCEQREHGINAPLIQIVEEVIPDLLSHSLRLANLTEKDLEVLYKNRLKGLKEKLKY